MILSKPQIFLTKFNDKYEICCHGNICASALLTSLKARYVILKACNKTGYVHLCCSLSLCNNIHMKLLGTQNILWLLFLAYTKWRKISTQHCWRQNAIIDVSDVLFKNALHTQVLMPTDLLLIKIISSDFQEMFIKASSFLVSKYVIFYFYTPRSLLSNPGPYIMTFEAIFICQNNIIMPLTEKQTNKQKKKKKKKNNYAINVKIKGHICHKQKESAFNNWTASSEFSTYRLCEQRRFRWACASAQSRQNLRCSLI